jgi:hypothetical protein
VPQQSYRTMECTVNNVLLEPFSVFHP